MNRRRRRGYKFTEKTHSKRGIAATVLSALLLVLMAGVLYLAYQGGGTLSAYYGSAGVMAMIVSVIAFVIAAKSLTEEDSFQLFPRLGLFLSVVDVVCWIGLYVTGFMQ